STVTESRNIDIARAINGHGIGIVIQIRRSVVAGDPQLLARGVVLDGGVVITSARPDAISGNMNIARSINCDANRFVLIIPRSVVAGDPLLLSGIVVLDRGIIKTSIGAEAPPCNIDIPRGINCDGIGKVQVVAGSAVTCNPLLLPRTVVLDRSIIEIGPCG